MALSRCKELHSNPRGRVNTYICSVEPVGYPTTSTICGIKSCDNPGKIWLTKEEHAEYNNGQRLFNYQTAVCKVKVK